MKVIDEKGRLFGKINVIDFFVILFLLCLVPIFYFGYRVFTKKPVEPKKDFIGIEIGCNLVKIAPEILALITAGDKGVDKNGNETGEIAWIGESQPYLYKFETESTAGEQPLIIEDQALRELPVKLKLKAEIRNDNLYYNEKQICVGSPLDFKTDKYSVIAVPLLIKPKNERLVQIKVKFQELYPELSRVLKKGDIQKDNQGRIIGTLKEITAQPSELLSFGLRADKVTIIKDPRRKDVVATFDLLCTDKDGTLYFYGNTNPVKIGNTITFNTDTYVISGLIIEIEK